MKKLRIAVLIVTLLILAGVATAVVAQDEPPPPYAGQENPFPWADETAQAAGLQIYTRSCRTCHGQNGSNFRDFDFSDPEYSASIESRPDFFLWVLSEGRTSGGMPGFKSSLSEEEIWQLLTYVRSLGQAAPEPTPTPTPTGGLTPTPTPPAEKPTIRLVTPSRATAGLVLTFTATIEDGEGQPVSGALVEFFLAEDFFAEGLMKIGAVETDAQGEAALDYKTRRVAETVVTARYGTIQAESALSIIPGDETFYHPEVGLPLAGPAIFIGPDSARELGELGNAPDSALRLPGGIFSWLWLFIGVLVLIWGIYFFSMFQALRISSDPKIGTTGHRNLPVLVLIIITVVGLVMVFMVITGPYSHFHLP